MQNVNMEDLDEIVPTEEQIIEQMKISGLDPNIVNEDHIFKS